MYKFCVDENNCVGCEGNRLQTLPIGGGGAKSNSGLAAVSMVKRGTCSCDCPFSLHGQNRTDALGTKFHFEFPLFSSADEHLMTL